MECITWFAPILPGKLDDWKALLAEINGPRKEEYQASRKRMGVSREVVSHMQTPQGDFVALFHEGEDISAAFKALASSNHPFDEWFKEKIGDIHGISSEMLQAPLPAMVLLDYKAG